MPLFLVPILIILGIFAVSAGGNFVKNIDVGDIFGFSSSPKQVQQESPPQNTVRQAPPPSTPAPEPQAPQKEEFSYAGWVEISRVRKRDPYLITLRTSIPKGETLTLTGWTLESRVETFTIPEGVKLIPAGLQGAVFAPIVLERGDSVKISGAQNPFKPKLNFRPNACFGYLKETVEFPVSVSSSCPRDIPKIEDVDHLTPACQDFILGFARCKEPPAYPSTSSFANDFQCRSFHENLEFQLSYAGCVRNHKTEENFFDNEWHIYVEEGERLIRSTHDRILLRDPGGVVIDEFVY